MAGFSNVLEERQFTNPHVRFRRIRGRIVPIYNTKRIGQDVNRLGNKIRNVGLAGIAAGVGMKALKRSTAFKKIPKFSLPSPKIIAGGPMDTKTVRAFAKLGRGSFKAAMAIAKRPGKVGAALAIVGTATALGGTELQLRSKFGKDF